MRKASGSAYCRPTRNALPRPRILRASPPGRSPNGPGGLGPINDHFKSKKNLLFEAVNAQVSAAAAPGNSLPKTTRKIPSCGCATSWRIRQTRWCASPHYPDHGAPYIGPGQRQHRQHAHPDPAGILWGGKIRTGPAPAGPGDPLQTAFINQDALQQFTGLDPRKAEDIETCIDFLIAHGIVAKKAG